MPNRQPRLHPLFNVLITEPIHGIPPGARVRVRARTDEWVVAFVRHKGSTVKHVVCRHPDGHLVLGHVMGANQDIVQVADEVLGNNVRWRYGVDRCAWCIENSASACGHNSP